MQDICSGEQSIGISKPDITFKPRTMRDIVSFGNHMGSTHENCQGLSIGCNTKWSSRCITKPRDHTMLVCCIKYACSKVFLFFVFRNIRREISETKSVTRNRDRIFYRDTVGDKSNLHNFEPAHFSLWLKRPEACLELCLLFSRRVVTCSTKHIVPRCCDLRIF